MPTVYGLYQHVFPPLIYMFLGTCKENSVGSHALISLVFSQVLTTMMTSQELSDPTLVAEVATALTMLIGLFMIGLYVLRMSWIATFLADPAVTGFFAGDNTHTRLWSACIHMFASIRPCVRAWSQSIARSHNPLPLSFRSFVFFFARTLQAWSS
jgi:hypothetical protein